MATCDRCGRPAWQSTGGIGGGLMPDAETHCLHRDGRDCRIARCGAAWAQARVVALLRSIADQYDVGDGVPCDDYYAEAYRDAVDVIERSAKDGGSDE